MAERRESQQEPTRPLAREDSSDESWERFSHWLCCVCVVTFDLELGQALEVHVAHLLNKAGALYSSSVSPDAHSLQLHAHRL